MHEKNGEIILDRAYELDAGVLPDRFPVSAVDEAIQMVSSHLELPARRVRRENRRLFGVAEPDVDSANASSAEHNRLAFMLSDLKRIRGNQGR